MHRYISGQRVVSDAELHHALGTVLSVEGRTVTVVFEASGETRTYAIHSAPLTRVVFTVGDSIRRCDGLALTVTAIEERDGLLRYTGIDTKGQTHTLDEIDLDNSMQLNRPAERLLNGQIDSNDWFILRHRTQQQLNRLSHSDLYGLTGARTSLIPHQLYIAHEVANRYAPRVLLADEVGLGKTIEAGLILHHQLLTERAHRVLIVVPETLLHQWLVEMLRRFNLHFCIFDADRLDQTDADEPGNPFQSEQLVLCSLDFLCRDEQRFTQCLDAGWDLLVVDEAHHLQWSPQHANIEYRRIEQLAKHTRGVLLLTATPEQLGKHSHFARLRLLDPDRFPDFDRFAAEERAYQPVAQVVEDLLGGKPLTADDLALIESTLGEDDNRPLLQAVMERDDVAARSELVEHLLDRHGTGRVLFRNTRAAVKGFPGRQVQHFELPQPEAYTRAIELTFAQAGDTDPALLLTPERLYQSMTDAKDGDAHWTDIDPRIDWLHQTLTTLKPQKVLVIAASANTAMDIASVLKHRFGIHVAVFHEGLSIIERDRAAAWFADQETGAQVLVCSEIGSEGRNFQFSHHLVLFDLPLNPDLLEQRIGRLDRIGQCDTIELHVPCLGDSAQQVMFDWYHQALDAFEHTCPAGHTVYVQVRDDLHQALRDARHSKALIARSKQIHDDIREALHKGRDRLLEYNSCRPRIAHSLQQQALQRDAESTLADYMDQVFDCFGVDSEPHSAHCHILQPTDNMQAPFPGLHDDGMTITYDRNTALGFEDAHFLTWEHPMVRDAMDRVIGSEHGNTAVTAIASKVLPAGSVLLECLFIVEAPPSEQLQGSRYLPATLLRIVLDERGRDLSTRLPHDNIDRAAIVVDSKTATQVIRAKRKTFKAMHLRAEKLAREQLDTVLRQAGERAERILQGEVSRLRALQQVNPNVRSDEIDYFRQQLAAVQGLIEQTGIRLDALRAIVIT